MRWLHRQWFLGASLSLFLAVSLVLGIIGTAEAETYEVQPGETLLEIAATLGIDPLLLSLANNISDPSYVQAGESLIIPDPSTYVFRAGGALVQVADEDGGVGDWVIPSSVPSEFLIPAIDYLRSEPRPSGPLDIITLSPYLKALASPRTAFLWPAFGQIATYYGEESSILWKKGFHEGLDIAANYGSIVRAADDGVVVEAGADLDSGYGNLIKVRHRNGADTLYAHLSRLCAQPGQVVKRGQVIGLVGNTGFSTGSHLHFGVIVGGQFVDPLAYLP